MLRQQVRLTIPQWLRRCDELGLEEDASICVPGKRPCMYADGSWTTGRGGPSCPHTPPWYRLNHSPTPNVELFLPANDRLCWRALRAIAKGEELVFTYARTDWDTYEPAARRRGGHETGLGKARRDNADGDGPPGCSGMLEALRGLQDAQVSCAAPSACGEPSLAGTREALMAQSATCEPYPEVTTLDSAPPLPGPSLEGTRGALHDGRMLTETVGGVALASPSFVRKRARAEPSPREQDVARGASARAIDMAPPGASAEVVQRLTGALQHAATMASLGAAHKTLVKDDHAWPYWQTFCGLYGWDPVVPRQEAVNAPDYLAQKLGLFTLWVYPQIRGRHRPDAKPRSVFNSYALAVARILKRDHKLPVPASTRYEAEVRGLLRAYKQIYGIMALAKKKRQPLTRAMWARIEALVPGQAMPGRAPWMAHEHDDKAILRLGRVLRKTAHRLGEIVKYDDVEVGYLLRSHCHYRIGGVPLADPSEGQLRMIRAGDLVYLAPCSTKPDQFGEATCSFPSVLEHDGTDTCAAAAIVDMELERPCRGADRASTPLFVTASGDAYTYGTLNNMLHSLVTAVFGTEVAATISWHSFRIGLACELRAAGCPDAVIQIICRWQCPESIQEYAQLSVRSHTEWLRSTNTVDYDAVRVSNLPVLDNSEALADLEEPTSAQRTRARQVVAAGDTRAAAPPPSQPPPPLLAKGDRVEVLWGGDWWAGSFTSSRRDVGPDGAPSGKRAHRILYDAARGWSTYACYHVLEEETWRRLSDR